MKKITQAVFYPWAVLGHWAVFFIDPNLSSYEHLISRKKFYFSGSTSKSPESTPKTSWDHGVPLQTSSPMFQRRLVFQRAHQHPPYYVADTMNNSLDVPYLEHNLSNSSLGHHGGNSRHFILKSDGELAIVAHCDTLAGYSGGKVVLERSQLGESQSNCEEKIIQARV